MRSRYTRNWTPTVRPMWYVIVPVTILTLLLLGGAW